MDKKKEIKKKKVKKKINPIGNKGEGETKILLSVLIFFGFLSAMYLFLPAPLQFFTPFDFAGTGIGIIAVAGTCVVATGLPCAGAIALYSIYEFAQYFVFSNEPLKLVIFFPLSLVLIYIIMRLARGGG